MLNFGLKIYYIIVLKCNVNMTGINETHISEELHGHYTKNMNNNTSGSKTTTQINVRIGAQNKFRFHFSFEIRQRRCLVND